MSIPTMMRRTLSVIRHPTVAYRLGLWYVSKPFRKSVTVTTKQGIFTLPMDVNDSISMHLYTRREYELDLMSDAMRFIREQRNLPRGKGTLLDIGANNGVTSIGMLVLGELERAIAIEPEPRNFSILEHNVKQNHLEDVITCLNCAASDSKTTLQFELSDNNYGDHRVRRTSADAGTNELYNESKRKVINVEADTLDNILAHLDNSHSQDISVVWIDVQGYEGYVFSGGRNLLSTGVPVVSEVWPYGIQRAGMSLETYCGIAKELWSAYWVRRDRSFVKYPVHDLPGYLEELGDGTTFGTVIFTQT